MSAGRRYHRYYQRLENQIILIYSATLVHKCNSLQENSEQRAWWSIESRLWVFVSHKNGTILLQKNEF